MPSGEKFEEVLKEFTDAAERSKVVHDLSLHRVLCILDENTVKSNTIKRIALQLQEETDAFFTFLLGVHVYRKLANELGISLKTDVSLLSELKKEFKEGRIEVAVFGESAGSVFERVKELMDVHGYDAIIIPSPFTGFAEPEKPNSLGSTIDLLLNRVLMEHRIPLMLIQNPAEFKIPLQRVVKIARIKGVSGESIGWIKALASNDAIIDFYIDESLDERQVERLELYTDALKNLARSDNKNYTINYHKEPQNLQKMSSELKRLKNPFLTFRVINSEDIEYVIQSFSLQKNTLLIFPPFKTEAKYESKVD